MSDSQTHCLNCGKEKKVQRVGLCNNCVARSNRLTNMLQQGITVGYADGSKQTYKSPKGKLP